MKYAIFTLLFLSSCTVSLQIIDTHGLSSDVVDEAQTASPDVSASFPRV